MKKLLLIYLVILPLLSIAQIPQGAGDDSEVIIDFIDSRMGERVGRGVCFDLVVAAMREKGYRRWNKRYYQNNKEFKKHLVEFNEVVSGDIMLFSGVMLKDGRRISSHIGIVYFISDSLIDVAEQNMCERKYSKRIRYDGRRVRVCRDSYVSVNSFDMREVVKGRIRFYRF